MMQLLPSDAPDRPKGRIALRSLGVALAVAALGFASTVIWLNSARDPSCGDSDCDQGVALIAVFFMLVSLLVGAVSGAATGVFLAIRHRPAGQRRRVIGQAGIAAALPLAFVLLYFFAAT